jgi:hypothetical protein
MMAGVDELFADVRTLEDVRTFIEDSYRRAGGGPAGLPLAIDEPGPLMAHAVKISGSAGLTRAELELLFVSLGQARFARGVAALRVTSGIVESREPRPNAGGLYQWQVVYRQR